MGYLRIENLFKNFGPARVLSGINLDIEEGTFCVVLGPSGCGKSTLLNVIAGLEEPTSGRVLLNGRDVTDLPPEKRDMAMVFQNYALYPHLNGYENMAFGLRVRGFGETEIRERILKASRTLGIEDKLKSRPSQLSGGQRQRLATGRAIVRDPALFLFDEPLSNLDARLRTELRGEFIKLHQRLKKTVVYVTHDQVEASVLGQVVVVLKDGAVQQVSPPQELYHNPRNLFVAGFIGSPAMNIVELQATAGDGTLFLQGEGFRFPVPPGHVPAVQPYSAAAVFFGIRPSAVALVPEGKIKGEVVFTETFGEDSFARVRLAEGTEFTVALKKELPAKPGETVSLKFGADRMYFFDGAGNRIVSGNHERKQDN